MPRLQLTPFLFFFGYFIVNLPKKIKKSNQISTVKCDMRRQKF